MILVKVQICQVLAKTCLHVLVKIVQTQVDLFLGFGTVQVLLLLLHQGEYQVNTHLSL